MRYRTEQIGYCSNVHPGESLAKILCNLDQGLLAVKRQRGLQRMHCGLWLSADAANTLQDPICRRDFIQTLHDQQLRLTTLNGFPFGQFHLTRVKEKVYLPDWSQDSRRQYTLALAELLADCLPADESTGSISTLPLGYAQTWSAEKHESAVRQLTVLSQALAALEQRSGKLIRVCLEMEPDCVLESSQQCLDFFTLLQAQGANMRYLGICYDVCHQAVMFEDAYQSLQRLHQAGIHIGKIQLSNAIRLPLHNSQPQQGMRFLQQFAESTYLHQCKAITTGKQIVVWPDLPALFNTLPTLDDCEELRVHFHVPLHWHGNEDQSLQSTQHSLLRTLDFLSDHPDCRPHLESETYTWQVMPSELRPVDQQGLTDSLCQELGWLESQMQARGLLE
ncbi:metabolite traffic protein EboE [Bowmanella denitrificans]|uniref:Metabolite traffic protein EboE n=1 Tax=Bowmanella denitrificans TaxID=366582 RepID=A0ABP3HQA0_9ALTE